MRESATRFLRHHESRAVAEFLSKAAEQAEFDRDIFARLVDSIIIKSRDNITFILKDGTEVKADTAESKAA